MSDFSTNPVHGPLSDDANTLKPPAVGDDPTAFDADPPGVEHRRAFSIREVADLLGVRPVVK